jgi:hypothetical protein
VGWPDGEPQWHGRRPPGAAEQKVGFSACQVLWKIAGRSASRAALLLHLRDPREREENTENFQANEFEEYKQVLAESVGVLDHWKWW